MFQSARSTYAYLIAIFLLAAPAAAATRTQTVVRLPGHVLPALGSATPLAAAPSSGAQPLTITIVLRRDNQAAFESYLHEIYDPHSKNFHHYLTQRQIADRFGPSRADYDSVLTYLRARGFHLMEGSKNRLTMTVRVTRAVAERAFELRIGNYEIGKQKFFANNTGPALPPELSSHVEAIIGLSNLAQPRHAKKAIDSFQKCFWAAFWAAFNESITSGTTCKTDIGQCQSALASGQTYNGGGGTDCDVKLRASAPPSGPSNGPVAQMLTGSRLATNSSASPIPWSQVNGAGQKIGLIEFDTFVQSDVANYLALFNLPATLINQLSKVDVNGGVPTPGSEQGEVLLDVDTTLTLAPGAQTVVYDAPFGGAASFQAILNQMISDKVTIISNSWAYCENQTTLADVQSIDSIFQGAAAAGVSVFNGAGDSGSTCLDGTANTVAVPADSPNATAVGGSSESPGPGGFTYGPEAWWNDLNTTPPAGQGGFGISKFFAAKSYQSVLTGSSMRSLPDVAANADPFHGVEICEASDGGCPNGKSYGGTSIAAPIWAAFAALLNQGQGSNLGFLNPRLYALANTSAFHNAAALNSDLAHVGLGSPNVNVLDLLLSGQKAGAVSSTLSPIALSIQTPANGLIPSGVFADGKTIGFVTVLLRDANGNSVSGTTVTLSGTGSASITPSSEVSTVDNGAVTFQVTDLTSESVTLTATAGGSALAQKPTISFITPPATSASLNAFPTTVTADGKSAATLTITMKDSLGRPTPGKVIAVTQGSGNSVISGPTSMVTDTNGEIRLAASDTNSESVTYAATDVTDGNLPIPNQPSVTFSNAPNPGCASGTPVGAPGLTVSAFATGFTAQAFNYGGVNWSCTGAFLPAFDASGNAYVADLSEGNIYKFPPTGGIAGAATLLTATPIGKSLGQMVFDNGELYVAQGTASPTNFNNGSILQIDPSNGTVVRTVASGLTCTLFLAADPLSGDLFTDDNCTGGGGDNPAIWRISKLATTPTVSVYTTLPNTGNGQLSFAPDGTLYAITGVSVGAPTVSVVSGTNGPTPPTVTTLSGPASPQSVVAQGTGASGGAQFLILTQTPAGASGPETTTFDLTPTPPITAAILTPNGSLADYGNMEVGPGGCLYGATNNAIFELTSNAGTCLYASTTQPPSLVLTPPTLSPNPVQGSAQTLTASVHYATAPTGTPVNFAVAGANPQIASVNTNANGQASFTYTAIHQGVDTITATATVAAASLSSNQAVITWGTGTDVTFLSLNPSQTSGTQGQPANLVASLTNVSTNPAAPLGGQQINFSLGGSSCGGTTNASGIASCQTSAGGAGSTTLSASFAGTSQYNASNASTGFTVVAPSTSVPTPTATPTPVAGKLRVAPKHLNFGTVEVGSSKTRVVHITNLGKVNKKRHPLPILIESESGAASPFSIIQTCADDDLNPRSKGVKPGTCEVSVTFTPSGATKYEGTLMIKDNLEPSFGQAVTLRGAGKTPK